MISKRLSGLGTEPRGSERQGWQCWESFHMGVGEGALRPCAAGFEVSRPVPESQLPLKEFFCFKPFAWLLVPALPSTK